MKLRNLVPYANLDFKVERVPNNFKTDGDYVWVPNLFLVLIQF